MVVFLDSRYKMMSVYYYFAKLYIVGLENQLKRVPGLLVNCIIMVALSLTK